HARGPVGGWHWGTTTEGPAVSRTRAAVLFVSLIFLLSAAAAHARPSFELADSAARAGDVVHFSISGVDVSATYEVAVDAQQVLEDVSGSPVSGTFTVPDLGDAFRTVSVEAEIRGPDKRKKIKRKLEYLGSALPVTGPPAPAIPPPAPPPSAPPPSAPPVVALGAPSPEPIYPPDAIEETPPAPAATPR